MLDERGPIRPEFAYGPRPHSAGGCAWYCAYLTRACAGAKATLVVSMRLFGQHDIRDGVQATVKCVLVSTGRCSVLHRDRVGAVVEGGFPQNEVSAAHKVKHCPRVPHLYCVPSFTYTILHSIHCLCLRRFLYTTGCPYGVVQGGLAPALLDQQFN